MRYAILGTTQAEDDQGTPIPLGGPRTRALLTTLALHPDHAVPTSTLIAEVWTDTPPTDAPAALQALIGRLRRTLGKHTITSEPGGYRLATTPTAVDLFTFEGLLNDAKAALAAHDPATAATTLREALTLWRGPALADLPDRTAAVRPEALRTEALRARIEADLQLGRASDVVPELRDLTASHPHDEPLHALLIRALHEAGRTAEALTTYEHIRRTLRDSLGADPSHALRTLHQTLLTPQQPPQNGLAPLTPTPTGATGATGAIGATRTIGATGAVGTTRTPIGTAHPRTGNIRPRLTSFVGRESELDAIRCDLRRSRLVTLTGPGGSGKTRLAEEAATGHPQARLAELAPLDRPEAVPGAVVNALGLRETALITHELLHSHEPATPPHDDPLALLVEYCAHRDLLLILDNCEHVIDAAAALAETLLTHCPGLTILATSREPLGVPGESVRPVDPLLPASAHRLFADRAASARPDADTVLRADPGAVAEICHRLDGLPLAIELAAARLRLLTPRQIADRLDDRFRLLTCGSRTALPRQQTLRAVVDWSWDLLDEPERTVLREVSVFAGGWDLEAAETVCTGPEPTAGTLGALVDKSLIVATPYEHDARVMRYRMLETIHEYATERVAETPALRATAELRHRIWVLALLTEAGPRLRSADQLPWIHRLETDLDNIRAALHRALTTADEPAATDLALAVGWFWWLRNFRHEGAHWLDRILTLTATPVSTPSHPPTATTNPPQRPPTPTTEHLQPLPPPPTPTTERLQPLPPPPTPTTERLQPLPPPPTAAQPLPEPPPTAAQPSPKAPAPAHVAQRPSHSPAPADGAELPPAPPVPDGESSTGGAGGQDGLDEGGAEAVDHITAFLADPNPAQHPRHSTRIALRLLHLALVAESGPIGVPHDPRAREYVARLRQESGHTGPAAARFPGLVWPLTAYFLEGAAGVDIHTMMDEAVTNCRKHGGDWEIGFTLMLRTHMRVDSSGNMHGVEADLAELRTIADRTGDRWMRAQVRSAAGEAAMARGRFTEARAEYEEALRLAYEVGANTESPFLIARLGEIAYRLGDREAALTALDEATAAAERFGTPDSRAFVCLLRAHMALADGETAHARDLWRLADEQTRRGTLPPQFRAFLDLVDGLLTTAESGPEPGLRRLTDALRTAVDNRCAETVTAAMADSAATVLSGLGDHLCAVRLLAAGTSWRGAHPRPLPDQHDAERAETAALAALGPTRYEAEHTTGTTYTPADALADLSTALNAIGKGARG